jgi:glutathione S-transferase
MLFYDCATAPSPRRVRMFIAEKGMDLPVREVDLRSGEHLQPEFRARNPDCTVPALELDDGSVISETLAICTYLEGIQPDPPLMGHTLAEGAEVLMWNARIEQQGLAAVAESFRNHSRGFAGRALTGAESFDQIPELVARGRRRAELFMDMLDKRLDGRGYIVGEAITMADITALVTVDMAAWIKLPVPEGLKNLRRWHEAVSDRPSARL